MIVSQNDNVLAKHRIIGDAIAEIVQVDPQQQTVIIILRYIEAQIY